MADASDLLKEIRAAPNLTLGWTVANYGAHRPAAMEGVANFVADSLKKQGVNVKVIDMDAVVHVASAQTDLYYDMFLSSVPIWRIGVRDPLQLISSAIGSAEITERIAEAQPKNSVDLLRSIERSLIEMGALRVLVEERMVWAYNDLVMPFFGPNGQVANLGAWLRK